MDINDLEAADETEFQKKLEQKGQSAKKTSVTKQFIKRRAKGENKAKKAQTVQQNSNPNTAEEIPQNSNQELSTEQLN